FETRGLLTFAVFLPAASYPGDPDDLRFDREFTGRLQALPGITGVASSSIVPLTGGGNTVRFVVEGQPMDPGHEDESKIRDVTSGYFSMMKIPLIAGRFFNDTDDSATAPKRVI